MLLVRLGPVSALRCSYCRLRRPETLSPFYCLFPDNHPKTSLFPDVSDRPPTPPGGLDNRKGRPLRAFYPGISPYGLASIFGLRSVLDIPRGENKVSEDAQWFPVTRWIPKSNENRMKSNENRVKSNENRMKTRIATPVGFTDPAPLSGGCLASGFGLRAVLRTLCEKNKVLGDARQFIMIRETSSRPQIE